MKKIKNVRTLNLRGIGGDLIPIKLLTGSEPIMYKAKKNPKLKILFDDKNYNIITYGTIKGFSLEIQGSEQEYSVVDNFELIKNGVAKLYASLTIDLEEISSKAKIKKHKKRIK